HLANGGGFGFWVFRSAVVKRTRYLWERATVDGRLANTTAALDALLAALDAARHLDELAAAWQDVAEVASPDSDAMRGAWFADLREPLDAALSLADDVREIEAATRESQTWRAPAWSSHDAVADLAEAAAEARDAARCERATDEIRAEVARVGAVDHAAARLVTSALDARDLDAFESAVRRVEELAQLHDLLARVRAAGAPATATRLARADRPPVEDLRNAWAHARARAFVEERLDSDREDSLRRSLTALRSAERDATCDLAEALAWHALLGNLGEHERQHLVAWTKAVRRVGKGTGKHAARHRRAAREHMEQCRTAIPCWVMPMYRVAESIRPGVDAFDVVIIDEASQSGPDALMLLYLTKQVIVVGDDKQISPDYVGLTRDDVEHLRQRHLTDLPHDDAFSLEHSLFDLAEIRYGNRVRLREHFRCMPEIIRFCNDLCYRTEPLIPLKQFGAGRLRPVVVTRHVADGYRDGTETKVVNPPEADAIVEQIAACHSDPAYEGKSFGVISLQGGPQAQLIEGKLLERLGPDVVLERDLVCGDAYAFQGDERDVMFLSLVAAPSEDRRIGTLADQRSERRFNVAVSRAREQLWLFHTARPDDLSPKCLRRALLEYCLDPNANVAGAAGIDANAIARGAADDRRSAPPEPFDSWFEVDVCRELVTRGYRVEPQFEVAGYRLDLVVVGAERRIAIECDGDAWHGVEEFDADQARQRSLERCGWTFVRIRGSAFYLDRKRALEPLWATLRVHGIEPIGSTANRAAASEA
ncbi:MAG: DUF559 domain-containing protein, partial [Planctomycetes bacterium]|nr:DUF559 domain-containing protein [Planctomycetota bacterium]